MAVALPQIELHIEAPCHRSWQEMNGNSQLRFCNQCEKNVYDLTTFTSAEVDSLFRDSQGLPCVRFYRNDDGAVITKDNSDGIRTMLWRQIRARSAWAASIFALLFLPGCQTATQGAPGTEYLNRRIEEIRQKENSSESK